MTALLEESLTYSFKLQRLNDSGTGPWSPWHSESDANSPWTVHLSSMWYRDEATRLLITTVQDKPQMFKLSESIITLQEKFYFPDSAAGLSVFKVNIQT